MTNKPLTERIKHVMELDAKRTQCGFVLDSKNHPGDIFSNERGYDHWIARCFADKKYEAPNGKFYMDAFEGQRMKSSATDEIHNNASFIAESPTMVTIIRELLEIVKVQNDALLRAKALSSWIGSINWRGGENLQPWLDDLSEKMTAFDAVRYPALALSEPLKPLFEEN